MSKDDKIILQVPLQGHIEKAFQIAFTNSGLESRTEYIRYLIKKDYNLIAAHYSPYGSEPEQYEINDEDIKD